MMKHKRVVISGIGMVTSLGIGKDQVFSNILKQKKCLEPIPHEFTKHYPFKSRFYVPFPVFDLSTYGISSRYIKMMQNEDQIAVLSALLAAEDAGFCMEPYNKLFTIKDLSDAGIFIGIGFSGLQTAFDSYCAHNCNEKSNKPYNRIVIPRMMPNSVAAWISIALGITGGALTMNASCASGTIALGRAFQSIRDGYYRSVFAGGVECMQESTGAVMRGFDTLGALTQSEDGIPRPFSNQRSGFLFSEGGGCVMILEEREHALNRGALIYAEIVDYKENSDAYSIIQINPDAIQIARLLKDLKGDRKIDYINSHGTATIVNDSTETEAIIRVFGKKETQPLINATKGILGHTIGASGAIEAAVTALSIKEKIIHGSDGAELPDINLVPECTKTEITHAISVSFGFGGHNAGLVFKSS